MKSPSKKLVGRVYGEKATEILKRIQRQMDEWGLRLPDVEPRPNDFGLNDFERIGETEFWIVNNIEANYCGKLLFVFDGQTCPKHMHRKKHETFFILKGKAGIFYDGRYMELSAGDTLPVDIGKYHSFTGIGPCLILEVSMASYREDNYFENTAIPIGGNYRPDQQPVPRTGSKEG